MANNDGSTHKGKSIKFSGQVHETYTYTELCH